MKRELSIQLLRSILPEDVWTEDRLRETVEQLRVVADHKYNKYEMYQPARLFFESLYLFLARLSNPYDRAIALDFIRNRLIFVSREEFQQLAHVLYYDRILQRQFDFASELTGLKRYELKKLRESAAFDRLRRASLYVALSDGARIDYFRRQNLEINNEQVLAAYYANDEKFADMRSKLAESVGDKGAQFDCLFLLDDFCGSGRTLLREVVIADFNGDVAVPVALRGSFEHDRKKQQLTWQFRGPLTEGEKASLRGLSSDGKYLSSIEDLIDKSSSGKTELKGSLLRISKDENWRTLVSERAKLYFSPLLITAYALNRLRPLLIRLPAPWNRLELLPAAVLEDDARILAGSGEIATFCETYYSPEIADEHTGDVTFGYDGCGLPLVLHHNTPNNSVYWLWSRKWNDPLFARYERHGREARS